MLMKNQRNLNPKLKTWKKQTWMIMIMKNWSLVRMMNQDMIIITIMMNMTQKKMGTITGLVYVNFHAF